MTERTKRQREERIQQSNLKSKSYLNNKLYSNFIYKKRNRKRRKKHYKRMVKGTNTKQPAHFMILIKKNKTTGLHPAVFSCYTCMLMPLWPNNTLLNQKVVLVKLTFL